MAKRGKYSNWVKSFGQSVKFGAKDVLTELAPGIAETSSSIAEDVRELKQDLRKIRTNKRQILTYLMGEDENFSKYGPTMWKNLKSGARTGRMIDPKRADKMMMDALGMGDMDLDFDDNFDFGGSDSSADFGDVDFGPNKVINMTGPSTEAMKAVSLNVSKTTDAVTEGFTRMEQSQRNRFSISEILQKRFHSEKIAQMNAMNTNLVNIVKFNNESMSHFVTASLEYYDKNLAVLNSINEAMLRISPVPKDTRKYTKETSPVDLFMPGGSFSLKGYSQLVAKNARRSFQNSMLGSIMPLINNDMLLADAAANPWAIPIKLALESMLPDRFKKSLGRFDKSLSAFAPALLTKIGGYKGNDPIMQLFSEIFGIRMGVRSKRFDPGAYDRGPIPFDGETKVAITREIPGFLTRQTALLEIIAAHMTSMDAAAIDKEIAKRAIIFNGSSGTGGGSFMRLKDAEKLNKREEHDVVTRAFASSRYALRDAIAPRARERGVDRTKDIDYYQMGLAESGEDMNPNSIKQIKRLIFRGKYGREATDAELKDIKLQRAAEDLRYAMKKLPDDVIMSMYGAERIESKTNLNNYRGIYGSNTEYGRGKHNFISKLSAGSATNLYNDKQYVRFVNDQYQISKDDFGNYVMSQEMIAKYNRDHGYERFKGNYLYTAKAIYEDIKKNEGIAGKPRLLPGQKTKLAINVGDKDITMEEAMERYGLKTDEKTGKMTITSAGKLQFQKDFNEATVRKDAKSVYKGLRQQFSKAKPKVVGTPTKQVEPLEPTNAQQEIHKDALDEAIDTIKDIITRPFDKLADLMDSATSKMKEIIFGKNGLTGNIKEIVFGKLNKRTGQREGGWLSAPINIAKDTYKEAKEYLFGDGKDKKGLFSDGLKGFTDLMKEYFVGKPKPGEKEVSVIDQMKATMVRGFGDLATVLFGNTGGKKGREKSIEQAKEAFNKAIPDMGKGMGIGAVIGTISGFGGFGLLGSLFLPGGPIGGAIVGAAMGLLKQSRSFREMMFGKEVTDKDGNTKRIGGLISDKVQRFFKAKKTPILGGAAMGVFSHMTGHGIAFGLMPSLFVGAFGPVIAGAAWGLLSHSKAFRRVIFGHEIRNPDGTIKKIGGIINAGMIKRFRAMLPRGLAGAALGVGTMGVISQMGLVGSMVATGPIPAAIIGAGLGIASASRKFTRYMFGYTDDSGKYHSGVLDRMKNFFNVEVFEPMKLRFQKELFEGKMWVRQHVFGPLRRAFMPIRLAMDEVGKYIKDQFKLAFSPIASGFQLVFSTIADNLVQVFKPLTSAVRELSSFMVSRFKSAIKMSLFTALLPIRALGGMVKMVLEGKSYTSRVGRAYSGVKSAFKSGTGLFGAVGELGRSIFLPGSSDNVEGRTEDAKDKIAEFEKREKKIRDAEERARVRGSKVLEARYTAMRKMQQMIRDNGYNLTNEQIREMQDTAAADAKRDEDTVKEAKASKDINVKLAHMRVEQGAETNKLLATIATNTSITNKALGVKADDNASAVDEQNRQQKEEAEKQAKADQLADEQLSFFQRFKKWMNGQDDDGKGKKKGWFWSLVGGIGKIAGGIFGIISKIGTIGAGILGIYGLLKMIFGDKSAGGTSDKLAQSQQMNRFTEIGGKKLTNLFVRHPKGLKAIAGFVADAGRAIAKPVVWAGKGIAKATGLSKLAKNADISGKISKLMGKSIAEGAEKKAGQSIFERISKALTDFLAGDSAKNLFNGKLDKLKTFKEAILQLGGLLKNPTTYKKVIEVAPKKAANATARTATAATGIGLAINVALGVYDGITGAMEADRLFDVNREDVTLKMRLISAFTNAFFGLPPMLWIDLILTAASFGALALTDTIFGRIVAAAGYDLQDFDHRKIFAQFLLELISDDEEMGKTSAAQKKFDEEYKEYLRTHNKEAATFSKEQYRAEMGNKSIWQKFGAPIFNKILGVSDGTTPVKSFGQRISGWLDDLTKWFKDAVKAITSFSPMEWFKELIGLPKDWSLGEAFTRIGDRFMSWMPENDTGFHPIDRTVNFGSRMWNKAKGFGSTVAKYFTGKGPGFYESMNDPRWKNKSFGHSTFGKEACAPLSLTMVSKMLGRDITPEQAASMAQGHIIKRGVEAGYFPDMANKLGMAYRENRTGKDLVTALSSRLPTVIGGSSTNPNSPFYGRGHYVVANGFDRNGKVRILNPTGRDKNKSVDIKTLVSESLGRGGYSGTFAGFGAGGDFGVSNGRASRAFADTFLRTQQTSDKAPKEDVERSKILVGLNEDESRTLTRVDTDDAKLAEEMTLSAKMSQLNDFNSRSQERNSAAGVKRQLDAAKKAGKTKSGKSAPMATKGIKLPNNGKYGFSDIMLGFGLGLKNLFSAIWGGTKYQYVTRNDIMGGLLNKLFGGGNISVSGKGCDTGIRAAQCALAHPDGEQWMGTVTPDSNIQCDSYAREIYREAGLEMPRMVVTDEDFKAKGAYFRNDGSYEPQLGDLIDWPKHVGIYVGGHNVNSRQSKGGVHTMAFEDAEKVWGPIKGFGSVSKYTGEPVHEVHGGGGGSYDASAGRIDTKKAVWNYLVNDLEINRAGAAGVMGNIEQESGFDVGAYNPNDADGNPSGGLVQWHASRFNNLKNYAASIGRPWDDVNAQMGYLGQELNQGYSDVYSDIMNAPTVDKAVATWVNDFEKPADKPGEIAKRTPMAYGFFKDHTNFVGGAPGFANYSGNQALAMRNAINNYAERYANSPFRISKPSLAGAARPFSATRILPSKVDTGGATMDDLLMSIRALDSHKEFEQVIDYLAIIARNGIGGSNKPTLDRKSELFLQNQLDKAKAEAKASTPKAGLSRKRYNDLMNTMEQMDGYLGKDMLQLAVDIAKGGKFRTS